MGPMWMKSSPTPLEEGGIMVGEAMPIATKLKLAAAFLAGGVISSALCGFMFVSGGIRVSAIEAGGLAVPFEVEFIGLSNQTDRRIRASAMRLDSFGMLVTETGDPGVPFHFPVRGIRRISVEYVMDDTRNVNEPANTGRWCHKGHPLFLADSPPPTRH